MQTEPSVHMISRRNEPHSDRFADEPVATVSARYSLCRGSGPLSTADPAVRPWGLRGLVAAAPDAVMPATIYDPTRQVSMIEGAIRADGSKEEPRPTPPTAPTTSRTDGEDPPSSEDWKNDYHPDFSWRH